MVLYHPIPPLPMPEFEKRRGGLSFGVRAECQVRENPRCSCWEVWEYGQELSRGSLMRGKMASFAELITGAEG